MPFTFSVYMQFLFMYQIGAPLLIKKIGSPETMCAFIFDPVVLFTFQTEVAVTLTPPTGKERAEGWAGLQGVRELKIKYEERDR